MTLLDCSITTPPRVEGQTVAFTVVHEPSGEAFMCRMSSFADVNVTLVPQGLTPVADGEVRGIIAEAALQYAQRNTEQFAALFEQTRPAQSDDA